MEEVHVGPRTALLRLGLALAGLASGCASSGAGLDGAWRVVETTEVEGAPAEAIDPSLSLTYVFDTSSGTVRLIAGIRDGHPPASLLDHTYGFSVTPGGDIRLQSDLGYAEYSYSITGTRLTLTRLACTFPPTTPPAAPHEAGSAPPPAASSSPDYRIVLQR